MAMSDYDQIVPSSRAKSARKSASPIFGDELGISSAAALQCRYIAWSNEECGRC